MTLINEKHIMYLVMVIECRTTKFIFRCFFVRGKKRKTFHQGAKDIEYQYSQVFRLAPRRELERERKPSEALFVNSFHWENVPRLPLKNLQ